MTLRLDSRSLVVTVGGSASGKSTWCQTWFRPEQVVSTDALRGVVGESPQDQKASGDAFDLVERILEARMTRGLLTVVDSTGLTEDARLRWLAVAREHGRPAVAVVFEAPANELTRRNRGRARPVPQRVVTSQARKVAEVAAGLADEGWTVVAPDEPTVVPTEMLDAPAAVLRQEADPVTLTFGLSLPRFTWEGTPETTRDHLTAVARAAEAAGLTSLHVMDHIVQVPSLGPRWEDMHEALTTLGFLAGVTETIRLGPLVAGITHRSIPLLGKAIATLDVLSGGRAICGIGAAWFGQEHLLLGGKMPDDATRLALLEDALRFLPQQWGPGTPSFDGNVLSVPEAVCYPRPIQDPHPPIWVGGQGEAVTLNLVAEHADGCNIRGDLATFQRKLAVLHRHCLDIQRDPAEITVTHLADVLVDDDRGSISERLESLRPDGSAPETHARRINAGTVTDHVGRFRTYAEAGLDHAIVSFPPVATVPDIEAFAPVIAAFG